MNLLIFVIFFCIEIVAGSSKRNRENRLRVQITEPESFRTMLKEVPDGRLIWLVSPRGRAAMNRVLVKIESICEDFGFSNLKESLIESIQESVHAFALMATPKYSLEDVSFGDNLETALEPSEFEAMAWIVFNSLFVLDSERKHNCMTDEELLQFCSDQLVDLTPKGREYLAERLEDRLDEMGSLVRGYRRLYPSVFAALEISI